MSWWNIIKKLFTTNPDNVATHTNGISKDDFKTAKDKNIDASTAAKNEAYIKRKRLKMKGKAVK
jgi:hypothetical protein